MLLTRPHRLCGLLICLISVAALLAQTPTAVVNGAVMDPSGAAVPDAKVTVVNQDTNVVSSKNTSADGTFTIINLLPGNYVLTVEKTRLQEQSRFPLFKLDVNQTLTEKSAHGSRRLHRHRDRQRRFGERDGPAFEHRIGHHHRRTG